MSLASADMLAFAPRLKIERAKNHIKDLESAVNAFLAERPFRLFIKHKPNAGTFTIVSRRLKPIPDKMSLIVGDAVHNLCAALDMTLYGMAHDKAPSPFELMFPFVRKSESLEGRIKGTQVNFAGTNVVELIYALQPYPGGNEILSGLHRLDARDKHRLLILTGQIVDFTEKMLDELFSGTPQRPTLKPDEIMRFLHSQAEEDVLFAGDGGDYRPFHTLGLSADHENETNLQPAYRIAFGKGQPFEFNPVVEVLRTCVDAVEQTVTDLIAAFLSPKNVR
jgi:hypothetical protein